MRAGTPWTHGRRPCRLRMHACATSEACVLPVNKTREPDGRHERVASRSHTRSTQHRRIARAVPAAAACVHGMSHQQNTTARTYALKGTTSACLWVTPGPQEPPKFNLVRFDVYYVRILRTADAFFSN